MKNIIIREYLESLTESDELDYIFPILLEVMNFKIISTPKETRGLAQYGKDIVAVRIDEDNSKRRYYFEIKGGSDRNVTTSTFNKNDGIRESLHEAKDRPYTDSSNPDFNNLPIKIVLVHNGTLHPSVKETFDGFIEREFPKSREERVSILFGLIKLRRNKKETLVFERWDIYQLTDLFTNFLFNEYLLTDEDAVKHFKKVLVLINTPRNNYTDFFKLINFIFEKAGNSNDMGSRKQLLFFETLKMISFIVFHYSKDAGNLEAAKRCIPYSILKLWTWILENKLQTDSKIIDHFNKNFKLLFHLLEVYFDKTLPIAKIKNGLWSPSGGKYEQIGFPVRTMDYLSHLILFYHCQAALHADKEHLVDEQLFNLITVLNSNDGTTRPFLDNHSIPICLTLNFLIQHGRINDAKKYLRNVLSSIQLGFETHKRLPDGNNRLESVIQFIVTGKKSVYYQEQTSHLFGILFEYLATLDMAVEYGVFKRFVEKIKIDLAVFMPYDDKQIVEYLPDNGKDHELNLLSHVLHFEGYQTEITLENEFKEFQTKTFSKPVFSYNYVSKELGFDYLILLAHVYYKTPLFTDSWRHVRI